MDDFKSAMTKVCDVGGLKCSCCNFSHETNKKTKRILRQNARAKLKHELHSLTDDEADATHGLSRR